MTDKQPVSEYLQNHNLQKLVEDALNECYNANASDPVGFLGHFFLNRGKKGAVNRVDKLVGREILDSRGNPTVEVDVYANGQKRPVATASAPSGASTGSNEAHELRDGDKSRYLGKGVLKAVKNVNDVLGKAVEGKSLENLTELDQALIDADGDELKSNLGGNAITACSFALATAGAAVRNEELFLYLARAFHGADKFENLKFRLPTPMVNILNGGKHAGGRLQIQEFMILPKENQPFREKVRCVAEVYQHLGKILAERAGPSAKNVGDEGGFAPNLETADEALNYIEEAIGKAGYKVGEDVFLALDAASSEFYNSDTKKYEITQQKEFLTSEEMVEYYVQLVNRHPAIISIEDGLEEKDYEGWKLLTERLGSKIMLVGDDLYTTNTRLIKQGIEEKWANALLLKVNQIGTITEAMNAARMIFNVGQKVIVSHRSGETATTLISDLVVGIGATHIKTGATARGERVSKYNRLLQIEEYLEQHGLLA
ncbi:hypothetical protein FDP41_001645 [Naegleria fowleri]|uniref:phosphopyruvate hydratase n=1 Tax=Naegleria fowleri TaxID=5763 RepID=A0A6A5BXC3_NAEFO|nr:uncharacterized protein FDP41_001645 [Naegleria fowleri]KAF0979302.1 hypothetical protein FDP41_001645 [Naegleria fowleri]